MPIPNYQALMRPLLAYGQDSAEKIWEKLSRQLAINSSNRTRAKSASPERVK